jgi:23S rRNA (adenine2030-N6)-methyltransferase
MLAYRHAFHAGNSGDALKHWLLSTTLQLLNQKAKPWSYFDTHAGAGVYALSQPVGGRLPSEWQQGVARFWEKRSAAPAPFTAWRSVLEAFNPEQKLTIYPGSPAIARFFAREEVGDRLFLFERHPTDGEKLRALFARDDRVEVFLADGWQAAPKRMPPAVRRGVVFVDPSYELAKDYGAVIPFVREVRRRFPQAVVMVWYPLLKRYEVPLLARRLRNVLPEEHLWVELPVAPPPEHGWGMYGSGMVVLQPPFGLAQQVAEGLPWLHALLAQPGAAEPRFAAHER